MRMPAISSLLHVQLCEEGRVDLSCVPVSSAAWRVLAGSCAMTSSASVIDQTCRERTTLAHASSVGHRSKRDILASVWIIHDI